MRIRPEHPREVLDELPWLGLATIGLLVTFALEHFIVHKQIILPALEIVAEPPLWMWGSMFVPELVVCFAVGWRLRSWTAVLAYAAAGASLREGFHYLLARAGEPGHIDALKDPFSDFAVKWPTIAVAYVLVLGLAAWSGQREGRLIAGG
ncbi:MAG TPA: hypothetical protein VIV57_12620 [Anaeromyxobacter sp.]